MVPATQYPSPHARPGSRHPVEVAEARSTITSHATLPGGILVTERVPLVRSFTELRTKRRPSSSEWESTRAVILEVGRRRSPPRLLSPCPGNRAGHVVAGVLVVLPMSRLGGRNDRGPGCRHPGPGPVTIELALQRCTRRGL